MKNNEIVFASTNNGMSFSKKKDIVDNVISRNTFETILGNSNKSSLEKKDFVCVGECETNDIVKNIVDMMRMSATK